MNEKVLIKISRKADPYDNRYTDIIAVGLEGELKIYSRIWDVDSINSTLSRLSKADQKKYLTDRGFRVEKASLHNAIHSWDLENQPKQRCQILIENKVFEYIPNFQPEDIENSKYFAEVSGITYNKYGHIDSRNYGAGIRIEK